MYASGVDIFVAFSIYFYYFIVYIIILRIIRSLQLIYPYFLSKFL